MIKTRDLNIGALICAIAIPIAVGALSSLITAGAMKQYGSMNKPALSPPGWLFPVVWSILYTVMGIASYYVFTEDAEKSLKYNALLLYAGQLLLNFFWSILFFKFSLYLPAFFWLVAMWIMILVTIISFFYVNKLAGFLMIPYLLWTTFAAYLNFSTYKLSIAPM